MRGKINILSALIRISPGNEIIIIAFGDGSARRMIKPSMTPNTTPAIVNRSSKFSRHHAITWNEVITEIVHSDKERKILRLFRRYKTMVDRCHNKVQEMVSNWNVNLLLRFIIWQMKQ